MEILARSPHRAATRRIAGALALGAALAATGLAPSEAGAGLPKGFARESMIGEPFGGDPIGLDFLPDGRPLVIERATGVVRLAARGGAVSESVLTIPDVSAAHLERGLLGVAVDPEWPARPHVYFLFTHVDSTSRIVRYSGAGDVADPASTAITLGDPYVVLAGVPDLAGIHNGGTLRFATDGRLLASFGDDSRGCEAQDPASALGKLLRMDVAALPAGPGGPPPLAALAPSDNPFPLSAGFGPLVLAAGLRNPFRFDVDGATGDVFVGDVGWNQWEEIDRVPSVAAGGGGENFGWPRLEGPDPPGCCPDCGEGNVFVDPIHVVPHGFALISVTGGPVIRPVPGSDADFPPSYESDYFYFEFTGGTLHRLRGGGDAWDHAPPVPGQPGPTVWADGLPGVSDARLGPDGALWFVSLGFWPSQLPRGVWRIRPTRRPLEAWKLPDDDLPGDPAPDVLVFPNPAVGDAPITVGWAQGGSAVVRGRILDAAGRAVATLRPAARAGAAGGELRWTGRDDRGRRVPAGVYFVRLEEAGGAVATGKLIVRR